MEDKKYTKQTLQALEYAKDIAVYFGADMVTEQYSHILDEDRVANARRVDEQVYNQQPQKTQADNTTDMNPTELLG